MINAQISLGKDMPKRLLDMPARIDSAVGRTVNSLAIRLVAMVKGKLSGQVLKVRTGRLRRSIHKEIENSGSKVVATVGTNVEYAKTHELGLTIPAHIVRARRAQALAFQWKGKLQFFKSVRIPAVKMPRRSFLEASLNQLEPTIRAELESEVLRTIKSGLRLR